MRNLSLLIALVAFAPISASVATPAANYPYKLGVIISVDQFRADYLMRIPLKAGYKKLRDEGSYFPLADHGLFQNMTCPGHAAILTGAYPYRHGISQNKWYDRDTKRSVYCVQDEQVKLVNAKGPFGKDGSGISPKNLNATTVGDELKNVDRKSRVVAIALKDRAAVMMGGKRPDSVVWLDSGSCEWISSQYYLKDNKLPSWLEKQNQVLAKEKTNKQNWGPYKDINYCSKNSLTTPWAVQKTFDLALDAVKEMKLGAGSDTDLLAISLSSHDYLGHVHGPNSEHLIEMTKAEDQIIGNFLNELAKQVPGGLNNVFVVVTGDHGIPPTLSSLPQEKIPNANLDEDAVRTTMENALKESFGSPKGGKWIDAVEELQFYLNEDAVKSAKISMHDIGVALRARMGKEKYIDQILMRDEVLLDRKRPAGDLADIVDHTFSSRTGDVLIVLKPYYISDSYPLTHMTHYSYDRYVPLVIWGKSFKPGIYRNIVRVVDLAPTLSSVLGVIPPSQSEGRVLNEIFR